MIQLSNNHFNSILDQARRESPLEACGYLAGTDGLVKEVFPMENVDQSEEHFTLNPKEQFAVIKQARAKGLDILAVYHSHPASPARPSEEDIRLAFDPNILYVIVSLMQSPADIKAFRINSGKVLPESIQIREEL